MSLACQAEVSCLVVLAFSITSGPNIGQKGRRLDPGLPVGFVIPGLHPSGELDPRADICIGFGPYLGHEST